MDVGLCLTTIATKLFCLVVALIPSYVMFLLDFIVFGYNHRVLNTSVICRV